MTALDVRRNMISGDGAKELSAAVLGHAKIEKFNEIPIKEMRAGSLTELDLKDKSIGVEGGMVVAGLVSAMASITSINLSSNNLTGGTFVNESKLVPSSDYKSGTKVTHEGQELTVLAEKDSDGDVLLGSLDGIIALADSFRVSVGRRLYVL